MHDSGHLYIKVFMWKINTAVHVYVIMAIGFNFSGLLQAETEQRPHKISFFVETIKALEIIKTLTELLENRGVRKYSLFLFSFSSEPRLWTVSS